MNDLLGEIQNIYINTDDIFENTRSLFQKYNKINIYNHSKDVSEMGIKSSEIFENDIQKIKIASYLHDIGGLIPNESKIHFLEDLNIDILEEEREFPLILHQKISKELARIVFQIYDEEILNSISCHTTLKANPSKMDMILFISDKIKWDQKETPPFLEVVEDGLKKSLENGIKNYLNYVIKNQDKLKIKVFHPWFLNAYEHFKNT